jgi:hypothetical protein
MNNIKIDLNNMKENNIEYIDYNYSGNFINKILQFLRIRPKQKEINCITYFSGIKLEIFDDK